MTPNKTANEIKASEDTFAWLLMMLIFRTPRCSFSIAVRLWPAARPQDLIVIDVRSLNRLNTISCRATEHFFLVTQKRASSFACHFDSNPEVMIPPRPERLCPLEDRFIALHIQ